MSHLAKKLRAGSNFNSEIDIKLTTHSLHLWLANLDLSDVEHKKIWPVLDKVEQQRALRFKLTQARRYFVAGRGLLRCLLGFYLSTSPEEISIELGDYGKPRLSGSQPDQGLVFNVSHSKGQALFGFARDKKFGVDLEFRRKIKNIEGMVKRCFSRSEESAWRAVNQIQRDQLFFSFWTAKEAMIKADGRGIALGIQRCQLEHEPYLRYTKLPNSCGNPEDWVLYQIDCGDDYDGALAIKHPADKIIYRDLSRKWLFDLYFPAVVG